MKLSPEELQALERSIEALRQFPHLRRAMIEALQIEELFAVPTRMDELIRVVMEILDRVVQVERIATEAKQEAREAKEVALEAKQEAREAKEAALEAKQEAREAKQIALEVRERMDRVEERLTRVENDVAVLKGHDEERQARRRIPAVLGRYFKKMRIYDAEQLYPLIGETLQIPEDDAAELLLADLFVQAQSKATQQEMWLVVEVSWGIGAGDVERAHERAAILQRYGYPARGVAMGRVLTPDAEQRAQQLGVMLAVDGSLRGAEAVS
ncbi:MAG: alanine-zipper protein [Fimbriimonadales bacterium]|nr:alanine-zipper protein [Fimbriimonadales bacterium]